MGLMRRAALRALAAKYLDDIHDQQPPKVFGQPSPRAERRHPRA